MSSMAMLFVAGVSSAAFATLPAAGKTTGDLAHGEELVKVNCSQCHAVGRDDHSAHPDAPEFRKLSERYPLDDLAEALAEGIVTGHPDMPEFQATPEQIKDIISYLKSIQG
jgi:mono/diheme cytochrome c family protein